jgi:amidophosphoribosyltransferase
MEAAEGESEIKGFEVGVFCGEYRTGVPKCYFEHLGRLQGKKRKYADEEEETSTEKLIPIAKGGPANVAAHPHKVLEDDSATGKGGKSPKHRGDIRYVCQRYA